MNRVASIPVVLPETDAHRHQCITCLQTRLARRPGIVKVEADPAGRTLQIDYDPQILPLAALEREVTQAQGCLDPNTAHIQLSVAGMQGIESERSIERALFGLPGVTAAVSYTSGQLRLEFDRRQCPLPEIVRRLDQLGYRLLPREVEGPVEGVRQKLVRRWSVAGAVAAARRWALANVEMALVAVGGVLLLAGFLVGLLSDTRRDTADLIRVTLLLASAVCTSTETFPEALRTLRRFRLDVDVLMFAAAIGAASLGHYEEGALLLFLFGLGSAGEHYALSRARKGIESLSKLAPETAVRIGPDGRETRIPATEVAEGDLLRVNPFERLPVDGEVVQGSSGVDQSAVTGESLPVDKSRGDVVFAGTLNTASPLTIRCTRPVGRSTLARIIHLVEEAQSTRSPTQIFTDRVEAYYVPAVFVATAALIVLPPLVGQIGWGVAFYRAMAFLTAASPCALAIGTPAAVMCAVARAARIGVLVKGGVHLENLATVRAMAFDKTGTLTTGQLRVAEVHPVPPWTEVQLLETAAAVERSSTHPLAAAIVRHAESLDIRPGEAETVEQVPGVGVRGVVVGRSVLAGKPARVFSQGNVVPPDRIRAAGAHVAVAVDGEPAGLIVLTDTLRPEAPGAVAELRRPEAEGGGGMSAAVMLTGDHAAAANEVAQAAGLDAVYADLLPEDKLRQLAQLSDQHGPVAMVGDGVNDAPALAQATVGIAVGGAGSDVAIDTADIVLLSHDLARLPDAVRLARRSRRIIAQNLAIALGVIAVVAPLAAMGYAKLSVAVLLHEGSTVVVVLNALRLLRKS